MNTQALIDFEIFYIFVISFIKFLLIVAQYNVFFFQSVPVFSVISLIISFFLGGLLLMFLGAEFLAFVVLVVYIGALAVLFLFIVMLLDLRLFSFYSFSNKKKYFFLFEKKYVILSSFLLFFMFFISYVMEFKGILFLSSLNGDLRYHLFYFDYISIFYSYSNIYVFGSVLYTLFFVPFILTSILLLVSLIAAINITLSSQVNLISQNSYVQMLRSSDLFLV